MTKREGAIEEEGEAAGYLERRRDGRRRKKEGGREARRVDNRARSCLSLVSFCCFRSRENAVDELRSLVPVDGIRPRGPEPPLKFVIRREER